MAKSLDNKKLDKVNGGAIGDIGWYYIIEYNKGNNLSSFNYTFGPYDSESLAIEACEVKKQEIIDAGYSVTGTSTRYNDKPLRRAVPL